MFTWEVGSTGSLRGRPLRYLLVRLLHDALKGSGGRGSATGALTVHDLVAGCEAAGVVFDDRASKLVSDSLRWEVRRGRVRRLARGVYVFAKAPRSTVWRIRRRTSEYLVRLDEIREARQLAAERGRTRVDTAPAPLEMLARSLPLRC